MLIAITNFDLIPSDKITPMLFTFEDSDPYNANFDYMDIFFNIHTYFPFTFLTLFVYDIHLETLSIT